MKCPACGLDVPGEAKFCNHCGHSLNEEVAGGGAIAGSAAPAGAHEAPAQDRAFMPSSPDKLPERVLWNEYSTMRAAVPVIVMWIFIALAIFIASQFFKAMFGPAVWLGLSIMEIAAAVLAVVIVLGILLKYYIRMHSTKYRLSNQRIFVTQGILNKRTDEIELEKYKDIFVNQNFWDRIMDCGDIEIVTSDVTNPTVKIVDIRDPAAKKETIRSAARERKSELGITRLQDL